MINMLPEKEKMLLRRESIARHVVYGGVMIGGIFLLGIFLLTPSFVLVRAEHERITQQVEEMQSAITGKGGAEDELKVVVSRLDAYTQREKEMSPSVSKTMDTFFEATNSAVRIVSFSFMRDVGRTGAIISGIGATRESLLDYQKKVKEIPGVKEAKFAESFITKKVDIRFTLTVTFE